MRRLLPNALASASLLVCLAGIITWGRSYTTGDSIFLTCGTRTVSISSEGGTYAFATFEHVKVHGVRWSWGSYAKRHDAMAAARSLVLFGWAPEKAGAHDFVMPQWTIPAVFGPLPAVRFARWLRRPCLARRRGFQVEPETRNRKAGHSNLFDWNKCECPQPCPPSTRSGLSLPGQDGADFGLFFEGGDDDPVGSYHSQGKDWVVDTK